MLLNGCYVTPSLEPKIKQSPNNKHFLKIHVGQQCVHSGIMHPAADGRADTRTDGSQKPQRPTHLPAPWPPHLRNARNPAAYFIIWSCGMPASAHVFKSRARKFIGMLISPPRPGPARPAVRGLSKYVVSRRAREEAVVFNLLPPPRRFKVTKIKKKKKKKTSTLTQCTGSSVVTAVRCSAGKY